MLSLYGCRRRREDECDMGYVKGVLRVLGVVRGIIEGVQECSRISKALGAFKCVKAAPF